SLERCQSLMVQVQHMGSRGREEKLNRNVVRAMAYSMTEVKNNFMRTCAEYTKYVNNRNSTSSFIHDGGGDIDNHYGTFEASEQRNEQWTQEQMLFLEDNSLMVE
ncbi:unnamed protein product, partial [Meganyctiphanes norvegica]